jgi:hypothetical protein
MSQKEAYFFMPLVELMQEKIAINSQSVTIINKYDLTEIKPQFLHGQIDSYSRDCYKGSPKKSTLFFGLKNRKNVSRTFNW